MGDSGAKPDFGSDRLLRKRMQAATAAFRSSWVRWSVPAVGRQESQLCVVVGGPGAGLGGLVDQTAQMSATRTSPASHRSYDGTTSTCSAGIRLRNEPRPCR
jgi:hypothetical protein